MLKKGDIVIIISVLLSAIISAALLFNVEKSGSTVTVTESNETVYRGSLFENKIIRLDGNTVVIKNGAVSVSDADCSNQICVRHNAITEKGESIICLPNRVIAEIE